MKPVIQIENISKQYRLGTIGTGTVKKDLQRWWAQARGKEDPFLKIGEANDRSVRGNSEFVWALQDINLEVLPGDVLGIIGKNGAGKSTLLKILSKVTGPTTGKIHFNGRIGSLLEVGTGFHPELTGRENIFLNGAVLGMTKQEVRRKMDEIVDFSGCERYIDTPVKRYSSGMTVRLGFAVAAHLEPEILVVDEVLAVGDAEFQKKAIGKMQDVSNQKGRTVLFVSHNMTSIQQLCNTCILLERGQVEAKGTPQIIIPNYLNLQAAAARTSIDKRTDRMGNGSVRISNIQFFDLATQEEVFELIAGQSIGIKLSFEKHSTQTIKSFDLGLTIFSASHEFKSVLNSKMADSKYGELPPNGEVNCIIPKLPLMYGDFYLTFTLQVNNEMADQVQDAKRFFVQSGDYFNQGYDNSYNRSGIYIEHEWI